MRAAAERIQQRCAVTPSPLASQRESINCKRALVARLGATPGTEGSNRAWGAQRERVERTLLSKTARYSSQERRIEAVRTPRAGSAANSCLLTGHRSYLLQFSIFEKKSRYTVKNRTEFCLSL